MSHVVEFVGPGLRALRDYEEWLRGNSDVRVVQMVQSHHDGHYAGVETMINHILVYYEKRLRQFVARFDALRGNVPDAVYQSWLVANPQVRVVDTASCVVSYGGASRTALIVTYEAADEPA